MAENHPKAVLLILLVDERPEEVSEMIDWGRGEVIASSFDLPHERHVAAEHARDRRSGHGGPDSRATAESVS